MKKETKIYTEYCIRNQIAAGGSDDWQIRLGKYVISLQYVDCWRWLLGPSCVFGGACPAAFGRCYISEKSRRSDQCHPANIGSGEGGQHYDRQCDGFETVRT